MFPDFDTKHDYSPCLLRRQCNGNVDNSGSLLFYLDLFSDLYDHRATECNSWQGT